MSIITKPFSGKSNRSEISSVVRIFPVFLGFLLCGGLSASAQLSQHVAEHWSLICNSPIKAPEDCLVGQGVSGDGAEGLFVKAYFSIRRDGDLDLTIATNTLYDQDSGISLLINDRQIGVLESSFCDTTECRLKTSVRKPLITQLLLGKSLSVQFRTSDAAGAMLKLDLSGFGDAIAALHKRVESLPGMDLSGWAIAYGDNKKNAEFNLSLADFFKTRNEGQVVLADTTGAASCAESKPAESDKVKLQVDSKLKLSKDPSQDKKIDQMIGAVNNCGKKYVIYMRASGHHAASAEAPLWALQQNAVQLYLDGLGVDSDKLWIGDARTGMVTYNSIPELR